MSLANLIRKRETVAPANANPAKAANDDPGKTTTLARLATLALANAAEAKGGVADDIPDPAAAARRQRVLRMLADNPEFRLAVVCDGAGDPVPVAVAIRDKGTCEVLIPAARFDPLALLELAEKHSGTLH